MMASQRCSVKIPLVNEQSFVELFPDELPEDVNDVIDVLRSELAPLKIWRSCAVEYYRHGNSSAFDAIISDILEALQTQEELDKMFRERDDYVESVAELCLAMAARELLKLADAKVSNVVADQVASIQKKCVDYIKMAEEKMRLNEYTWIIKSFFEILQGEVKRAEEDFRVVYERASKGQNATKKKFLFVSLVGLGLTAYLQNKHKIALDYFSKAVLANPQSDPSLHRAIACCHFKLGDFDRAEAVLSIACRGKFEVSQLILWALIRLAGAGKDRNNRVALREAAFELAYMVHVLDPVNASALNLLANYYFHAWQCFPAAAHGSSCSEFVTFQGGGRVLLNFDASSLSIKLGNQLRFEFSSGASSRVVTITNIEKRTVSDREHSYVLDFSPPLGAHSAEEVTRLHIKSLHEVVDYAQKALTCSSLSAVKAESYFILGKVAHSQGDSKHAFDLYRQALSEAPDMALAAFGAAQILFSGKEFNEALELFEKVLKSSPEDKDTLAYVILLRGILRGEQSPLDKIKEAATGFQFDVDIWLSQAQLRHKRLEQKPDNVLDFGAALKCYVQALECLKSRDGKAVPSPSVLNNMGVLYFALGNKEKALNCFKESLIVEVKSKQAEHGTCDNYAGSELSELVRQAVPTSSLSARRTALEGLEADQWSFELVDSVDLPKVGLVQGRQVTINNTVRCTVSFTDEHIVVVQIDLCLAESFQNLIQIGEEASLSPSALLDLTNEDLMGLGFNIGRVFEDLGYSSSASEIYLEILQKHPSNVDCYIRLACIARAMGQLPEALAWLQKAQRFKDESVEIGTSLGELYLAMGKVDEAKKVLEKLYLKHRKDVQLLLSQANFYYQTYVQTEKVDLLRTAYKFFHPVLSEHVRNVFAANGLGIICAEKSEHSAAREIFNKIREAQHSLISEDVCVNLAHICSLEGRYLDAERLYLAAFKTLLRSSAGVAADSLSDLCSFTAFAQVQQKKEQDSKKSMLRALHLNPFNPSLCLNAAAVCELHQNGNENRAAIHNGEGTIKHMHEQLRFLAFAARLVKWSCSNTALKILKADGNVKKSLTVRGKVIEDQISFIGKRIENLEQLKALSGEERKRIEEEHQERLRHKEEAKRLEEEKILSARSAFQLQAQVQEERLRIMKDEWGNTQGQGGSSQGEGGKKRVRKASKEVEDRAEHSEEEGGGDIFDSEGEKEVVPSALTTYQDIFPESDEEDDDESKKKKPRGKN